MEIFNVHLFEFILIAGLALVLFGPERLPEVGRWAGRQVAKFLAWQQQSPELQMINEMRSEFEREIAQLRDELARARNQLDVRDDVKMIVDEAKTASQQVQHSLDELKTSATPTIRPPAQPPVPAEPTTFAPPAPTGVAQPITDEDRALFGVSPEVEAVTPDRAESEPLPISQAELTELMDRLTALTAELQALVFALQERGLLDQNWQPVVKRAPMPEELDSRLANHPL